MDSSHHVSEIGIYNLPAFQIGIKIGRPLTKTLVQNVNDPQISKMCGLLTGEMSELVALFG